MPGPDPTAWVIREWVVKAENDLRSAAHVLKMGADCPTDIVCFHAQQCVEKYLKSLLVLKCIPVPRTHNIRVLMNMIPADVRPELEEAEQDRLTVYAVVARDPADEPPVPLSEARQAVRTARRVRSETRKKLPAASLRRRHK
jgi:HEPN domain-containing protein